jgi:hypothetical protein
MEQGKFGVENGLPPWLPLLLACLCLYVASWGYIWKAGFEQVCDAGYQ